MQAYVPSRRYAIFERGQRSLDDGGGLADACIKSKFPMESAAQNVRSFVRIWLFYFGGQARRVTPIDIHKRLRLRNQLRGWG
jgi:hypothetical protein